MTSSFNELKSLGALSEDKRLFSTPTWICEETCQSAGHEALSLSPSRVGELFRVCYPMLRGLVRLRPMVRRRGDRQSFLTAIGRRAMRGGELMKWLSYLCSCLQVKRPAVAAGMRARFALGDRVSVREGSSQEGGGTPSYVRGKSGVVEEVDEAFTDSKKLIANRGVTTPLRQMYRMRFVAREVWPDSAPGDTLSLRISEDQLEPSPTKAS